MACVQGLASSPASLNSRGGPSHHIPGEVAVTSCSLLEMQKHGDGQAALQALKLLLLWTCLLESSRQHRRCVPDAPLGTRGTPGSPDPQGFAAGGCGRTPDLRPPRRCLAGCCFAQGYCVGCLPSLLPSSTSRLFSPTQRGPVNHQPTDWLSGCSSLPPSCWNCVGCPHSRRHCPRHRPQD